MSEHGRPSDTADPGAGLLRRVDEVTGALEDLSDVLTRTEELPAVMNRVCRQVLNAVPDADMASISVLREGRPETVATTDQRAVEIDRSQYDTNEGPCLESAKTGEVVRVTIAEAEDRWPSFVEAARTIAVASYLSAPMFVDDEYHGSLNLYSTHEHGFGRLDAALLELYTTAAEAALHSTRLYLQARRHAEQLTRALASRAVIDQAKGIIMAIRRVSADEAFAILTAQSQAENIKVREVAERFLTEILAETR